MCSLPVPVCERVVACGTLSVIAVECEMPHSIARMRNNVKKHIPYMARERERERALLGKRMRTNVKKHIL